MKISDLAPPVRLLPSPTAELARLSLEQVRSENAFFVHLATWTTGSLAVLFMVAIHGFEDSEVLVMGLLWGAALAVQGWRALVRGRQQYRRKHHALQQEQEQDDGSVEQGLVAVGEVGLLRQRLLRAAEDARVVLRTAGPVTPDTPVTPEAGLRTDVAAEVSRGETEALATVAWLDEAERVLDRRRLDPGQRLGVARQLSDPENHDAREQLEQLLAVLDFRDSRVAALESEIRLRRSRVESFLLALENVKMAPPVHLAPAISASISERVALLESSEGDEEVHAAAARIREEVRLAQDLQRTILPAEAPGVAGLRVAHVYRPSSEVGGDFYDFYATGDRRLLIALGDASGHGLDASMVSSMAKSALYLQVSSSRGLADAMAEINRMMCDTLGSRRLMTLTLLEIDTLDRRIAWVNAGHLYPLLLRDGQVRELEAPGYPLGVRRQLDYTVREQGFEPGDLLLLLTDGYVEAADHADEPYGWERLMDRLPALADSDPQDLLSVLLTDLTDYLGTAQPQDDVTLIAIACEP